jgi:hypothetical protein
MVAEGLIEREVDRDARKSAAAVGEAERIAAYVPGHDGRRHRLGADRPAGGRGGGERLRRNPSDAQTGHEDRRAARGWEALTRRAEERVEGAVEEKP